jgi:hypothetical protein
MALEILLFKIEVISDWLNKITQLPGIRPVSSTPHYSESMSEGFIVTDKTFYRAGDLVTGKVALHLDRTRGPLSLELSCTGISEVAFPCDRIVGMIMDARIKGNPPLTHSYLKPIFERAEATEGRTLFRLQADQTLQPPRAPTDISVPFEIKLPEGLPASFALRNDEGNNPGASANVSYKLICTLTSSTGDMLAFSEDFVVGQAPQTSQGEYSKPVSLFRCISQGHLSCTLQLSKDVYAPGEGIALNLFLGSEKLTASFDRILVSLHQTLNLKANSQARKVSRTILKYRFDGMSDIKRVMLLELPEEAECSTSGDLIDSSYLMRVKFSRRFGTDIIFEAPVQVQMAPTSASMKGSLRDHELLPLNLLALK